MVGQDNFLRYVPHAQQTLRVNSTDAPLDILRVRAAALTCGAPLELSATESESAFIARMKLGSIQRLRLLSLPSPHLLHAAAEAGVNVIIAPVMANGRIELLHHLREVSLSIDYHRYGYLGLREDEERHPLPGMPTTPQPQHICACRT